MGGYRSNPLVYMDALGFESRCKPKMFIVVRNPHKAVGLGLMKRSREHRKIVSALSQTSSTAKTAIAEICQQH